MKSKFLNSCAGNIGITLALALVPLLIAGGVAIDMVRLNNVNTTLQAAADSAALAGATSKQLANSAALTKIVNSFLTENKALSLMSSGVVVDNHIDPSTGAFVVNVKGKVDTAFMKLVGMPTMDVGGMSAVNLGMQGLELALVLDNTGSMSGAKIAALKTAAKQLISILESAKADYSDLKFALVPFSQYVDVGIANRNASWIMVPPAIGKTSNWNGCIGSRNNPMDERVGTSGSNYPGVLDVACPAEITPLTTNTAVIKSEIDRMVAGGSTYIPTGLLWGWNVLDSSVPYTEGRTAAQLAAVNGRKVIVLMTDGENTASPIYPDHSGRDAFAANKKLESLCANVKADGIEVFTVSFQVPTPTIKAILSDCATDTGHAFDADNSAMLMDAFMRIGDQLSGVRLVQ